MPDYQDFVCIHYDVEMTERKCPVCGTVFYACPICYPYHLCDTHRAEQINRLIDDLQAMSGRDQKREK